MASLICFLDDSATRTGSRTVSTVSVGGFVARRDDWDEFASQWSKTMLEMGLTRWHATDALALEGEFRDWNFLKVRMAYIRLDRIVRAVPRVFSVAALVNREDFERVSPTARARFGSAYSLACHMLFGAVGYQVTHQGFDSDAWIDYVIDHPGGYTGVGQMKKLFDEMKSIPVIRETARLGSIVMTDNRASDPLQAADIVAHDIRRGFDAHGTDLAAFQFALPNLGKLIHVWQRADQGFIDRVSASLESAIYYP